MLDMFGDAFTESDDSDNNVYAEYINAREWTDRERLSGRKIPWGFT